VQKLHLSPYAGDAFHQAPLILPFFYPIYESQFITQTVFVVLDILCAFMVAEIVALWQVEHRRKNSSASAQARIKSATDLFLERDNLPQMAALLYLFNPFVLFSCLGMSTLIFSNLAILCALYFALSGNLVLWTFSLAVATYMSIYPIVLIFSLSSLYKSNKSLYTAFPLFLVFLGTLLGLSFLLLNSWDFLRDFYGFTLLVSDLTPNIGLFWYFFTEVFKHYQNFYLFAYQYHAFLYAVPLFIRLPNHPMVQFWANVAIIAAFKSYPAIGDIGLQVALIPLIFDEIKGNRYGFIVVIVGVFVSVLAPIFWSMWIYQGTGNANFYYAINLALTLAQVMFIIDSIAVVLKEDYSVKKQAKSVQVEPETKKNL